jgi:hypothetical protein
MHIETKMAAISEALKRGSVTGQSVRAEALTYETKANANATADSLRE